VIGDEREGQIAQLVIVRVGVAANAPQLLDRAAQSADIACILSSLNVSRPEIKAKEP